jgi:hypothetical protein
MSSDSSSATDKSYSFTITGVPSSAAVKKDLGYSVGQAHVLGKRALAWRPG